MCSNLLNKIRKRLTAVSDVITPDWKTSSFTVKQQQLRRVVRCSVIRPWGKVFNKFNLLLLPTFKVNYKNKTEQTKGTVKSKDMWYKWGEGRRRSGFQDWNGVGEIEDNGKSFSKWGDLRSRGRSCPLMHCSDISCTILPSDPPHPTAPQYTT